jgi:aspartyl protease family protein
MIACLRLVAVPAIVVCSIVAVSAGYLNENPDEVFAAVYARLGVNLPVRAARDPAVWLRLEELKREPCDQTSISDLGLTLEKLGYRREAAQGLYNFVRQCGAPTSALQRSIDIFLKLSDYPMAVEVADEFIRRAPTVDEAHYLRGVALEGVKDFRRALADYADAIELFVGNKKSISSRVFLHMASAYAELGRFCEAASPIYAWVAIDPVNRDTSSSRKIIADYEQRGQCAASTEGKKERYPLGGQQNVVTVKAEINGVRGRFIIDTGASYVSLKAEFADRAKIPQVDASEITLSTANGPAHGKLAKADKVLLGRLEAANVPVVVQKSERTLYGAGIDGLLGMSFLSRFEMQLAGGFIELRTRRPK